MAGLNASMDYEYRAQVIIIQGGYPGEWKGVDPEDTNWNPGTPGQKYGPLTYKYYYTDSNSANNNNSSRVTVDASDEWTADFDDKNNLIITITTKINSIVRGNINGNPLAGGNWTRDIKVGRDKNNTAWYVNGDNIGHAHTLSGPIDLGTETITIPPGGKVQRGSVYVLNHTTGLSWSVPDYTDEMWMGITFRNPRDGEPDTPVFTKFDYRPGANYNGSSWMSHNRNGGAASIFNGIGWAEMRTHYGPSYEGQLVSDDPPYMRHAGTWYNMRNIGNNRWPNGNPYIR